MKNGKYLKREVHNLGEAGGRTPRLAQRHARRTPAGLLACVGAPPAALLLEHPVWMICIVCSAGGGADGLGSSAQPRALSRPLLPGSGSP